MNGIGDFFAELRRRHVVRAALAHLVFFWLLIQVADVVLPYLGIVDQPVRWAVVAGVALFPVTLLIAWFFEHPWHQFTGSRVALDVVVILVIAVTAGMWVVRNIPQLAHTRTSIVVLPFEHADDDPLGQTLSRALAYEVNSLLMKSKSIDVVGYESATSPLLAGLDLPAIAELLNVQHVLSGTISSAGNLMSISVSLRDNDGQELWDWSFEDDLDDLFSVQERIASDVSERLGSDDGQVTISTIAKKRCDMPTDPDVLERYYTARNHLELRGETEIGAQHLLDSVQLFEGLVEEFPDFAEARSGLAWAYWVSPNYDESKSRQEMSLRGREQAEIAFDLCDTLGEAMVLLPNQFDHDNGWISGEQQFTAAIEMEPHKTENVHRYTRLLRETGRLNTAMAVGRKSYQMNPLSVRSIVNYAAILQYAGQLEESAKLYDDATALGSTVPNFARGGLEMAKCDGEDIDCLLQEYPPYVREFKDRWALILLKPADEAAAATAIDEAMSLLQEVPMFVNMVNMSACTRDHLTPLFFKAWDFSKESGAYWYWPNVWHRQCNNVWMSEEFPEFSESVGLVEYWRAFEWADVCRVEDDTFSCGSEEYELDDSDGAI